MKHILLICALGLSLSGCALFQGLDASQKSILQGGVSLTAEIGQPITNNQMAVIEGAYRAAIVTALSYRRQGICPEGTNWTIQNPCAERSVLVVIQRYYPAARSAMISLRRFRKENDTVNAFKAFTAAKQAIADLQNELYIAGVK